MSMAAETLPTLPTGTWSLDHIHSRVGFAVAYLVGTVRATFAPFEATLEVTEDGRASLAGSTEAKSVSINEPRLLGHLLAPDFFDADRTPEIRFASTSIEVSGTTITVGGDLTIKGSTQPVTLEGSVSGPIVDPMGNERLGLQLRTTVDRTRFGLDYNFPLANGENALANEVLLEAELFLIKA